MRHGFAGVRAMVDHEAKTLGELELAGDRTGDEEEMAEDRLVLGFGLTDPGYHFFGDNQEVDGRLRLDVVEHDTEFILVFDAGRDLARDDFFKDGHRRMGDTGARAERVRERSDTGILSVARFRKTDRQECLFHPWPLHYSSLQKQQLQIRTANGAGGGEFPDEAERLFVLAFAFGGGAGARGNQGGAQVGDQKRGIPIGR